MMRELPLALKHSERSQSPQEQGCRPVGLAQLAQGVVVGATSSLDGYLPLPRLPFSSMRSQNGPRLAFARCSVSVAETARNPE